MCCDALKLAALRADMSAFYQREIQCDDRCKAYIVERSPGVVLLSPNTQLKLDCTAMASSEQRCVTDLLAEKLPVPLTDRWLITAAQINLYYPVAAR